METFINDSCVLCVSSFTIKIYTQHACLLTSRVCCAPLGGAMFAKFQQKIRYDFHHMSLERDWNGHRDMAALDDIPTARTVS